MIPVGPSDKDPFQDQAQHRTHHQGQQQDQRQVPQALAHGGPLDPTQAGQII